MLCVCESVCVLVRFFIFDVLVVCVLGGLLVGLQKFPDVVVLFCDKNKTHTELNGETPA